MFTKGETLWGGEINQKVEIDTYTLLYMEQTGNDKLMYTTGKSTQYCVLTYMGKESEK